jgi:hypothetical protein
MRSMGSGVPHKKHITSPLLAHSVNAIYRCVRTAQETYCISATSYRSPGFDSRRHNIFWVAVDLERGPLSLVRINEEINERKVAAAV